MLADVILGTRCVEVARIGDLAVLMRALSELELEDALLDARALVASELPGPPDAGLVKAALDRRIVSLASVDPSALRDGRRVQVLAAEDVEALPPAIVDELLIAQTTAQRRALPILDDRGQMALQREVMDRAAKRYADRLRARGLVAHVYFDLAPRAVTGWQAFYFAELSR